VSQCNDKDDYVMTDISKKYNIICTGFSEIHEPTSTTSTVDSLLTLTILEIPY
jgi:hypothetical protein